MGARAWRTGVGEGPERGRGLHAGVRDVQASTAQIMQRAGEDGLTVSCSLPSPRPHRPPQDLGFERNTIVPRVRVQPSCWWHTKHGRVA